MRRLGSPFRILGAVTRSQPNEQIRFAGTVAWRKRRRIRRGDPLRTSSPTFEFPEVVLDLDAEDSAHVRPMNEADWRREIDKYAVNPAVEAAAERVSQFEQEKKKAHEDMMVIARQRHSVWHVSDLDVLTVALKGAPRSHSSSEALSSGGEHDRAGILSQVLQLNGITDRIRSQDDTKVIHFMLHRQGLAQRTTPFSGKHSSVEPKDVHLLEDALSGCEFYQMQRLVLRMARNPGGCQVVRQCGDKISKLCRQFQQQGLVENVLILLNNLTTRFESQQIDIGEQLCVAGIRTSIVASHPPAALRYLELAHGMGYDLSILSATEIQEALEMLLKGYSFIRDGPDSPGWQTNYRPELFTLLTGRSLTSHVPQASFRATIGSTFQFIRAYHSYIVLLGELGALRMLWHEWHTLKSMKGQLASELQQSLKHQFFADALAYCATSLQHRRIPFAHEDYTTTTGDFAEDAALDLKCIHNQKLRMIGQAPAQSLQMDAHDTEIIAEQLRDQVRRVFRAPNIGDAMGSITALTSTAMAGKA